MTREMRKPPAGAPPGTLEIPPGAKPVLRVVSYDRHTLQEHEVSGVDDIRTLRTSGRNLWVDVQGLSDESLLRGLADLFTIHPLALEDLVHFPVRPKTEQYETNLLVITQTITLAADRSVDIGQVSLVIGRDYLLTFRETRGDALTPVRKRLQVQKSLIRTHSPDYLAYAILDTIIDSYYPVVESMGERIQALEERIMSAAPSEILGDLNTLKGQFLALKRGIAPQRESVNALIRDENVLVSKTVRTYLRDTYDHIMQTVEAIEGSRELVGGLINTYLSVLSNRMNEVMKTLTIIASIFVPLTFMAGIYGMNFQHMPELAVEWAYPGLLIVMGLTAVGMLVYFWRKGWIGRR